MILFVDLPIAWWSFWMTAGAIFFLGLVWLLTRLALNVDEDAESERPEEAHGPNA